MSSIREKTSRRLENDGKSEEQGSLRIKGDHMKRRIKAKKVPVFRGNLLPNHKRVANNSFIPPRMLPSQADRVIFRQEIDQETGTRPLPKNPPSVKLSKLDEKKFARVANNLFRGEESVLDQSKRLIFNHNIKRDMSIELNKLKQFDDKKETEIIKAGNIAEKAVASDKQKQLLSEFTGPVKQLIQIGDVKQILSPREHVRRRIALIDKDVNESQVEKLKRSFMKKLGVRLSPKEEAELQKKRSERNN